MADKLIIDREKWYRGKGPDGSRLLRTDGCRCCLGFDLQRRGFTDEQLLDVGVPEAVETDAPIDGLTFAFEDERDGFGPTGTNELLVEFNDNPDLSESERELRITSAFAEIGVEVEFVG